MITKPPNILLLTHDENKLLDNGGFLYLTFQGEYGELLNLKSHLKTFQFEEIAESEYYEEIPENAYYLKSVVKLIERNRSDEMVVMVTERYKFNKIGLVKFGFELKQLKQIKNDF